MPLWVCLQSPIILAQELCLNSTALLRYAPNLYMAKFVYYNIVLHKILPYIDFFVYIMHKLCPFSVMFMHAYIVKIMLFTFPRFCPLPLIQDV